MTAFPPHALRPLLDEISSLLKGAKQTVSVAETAAGGLISAALLSVPGASAYYAGGLTVYTLKSRIAFAGWSQDNIKDYKGPTPEIVAGLATHVRNQLDSTFAISESGTAGPTNHAFTSGTLARNKTPGYVALAVASRDGVVTREVDTGTDDREANMVAFAEAALTLLRDVLKGEVSLRSGRL